LLRVGRAEDCEIRFPDIREMSRYHFRVQRHEDGTYSVTDTGSANGTFFMGSSTPIAVRELRDGDVIEAGGFAFVFIRS
jgi:pSer/pThr/pTyr-binding forkhead associated (FHA) protein